MFNHRFSPPVLPPYPSHAFKGLLGEMTGELYQSGIDPVIIGSVAMQVATTATHGFARVKQPNGMETSSGANLILVAPPVSGKTIINRVGNGYIERAVDRVSDQVDEALIPDFYLEDVTREGAIKALDTWKYRTLNSDEASPVFQGMKNGAVQASIIKMAEGNPFYYARSGFGRIKLHNYGMRWFLCIQPEPFEEAKEILKIGLPNNGLANRYHYSKGGWLVTAEMASRVRISEALHLKLEQRFDELVKMNIDAIQHQHWSFPAIPCSREAELILADWVSYLSTLSAPGGRLHHIAPYCSRSHERIRGWTATSHAFEYGPEGQVSGEYMRAAIDLDQASIEVFNHHAWRPPKLTKAEEDGLTVQTVIGNYTLTLGHPPRLSELKKYSTNFGMSPSQVMRGLKELGKYRLVQITPAEGGDVVQLLPGTFFQPS